MATTHGDGGRPVGHPRTPAGTRAGARAGDPARDGDDDRPRLPTLRLVGVEDARAVAAIYAPWVRDTTVSLELVAPTAAEMAQRVAATMPRWPWLVAQVDDRVVGYAYGGSHRGRPGYRWTVEVSAYVAPAAHGHGVGRRLYTALLGLLADQGHHLALAGVGLPNPASVGFHEALGFHHVGTFREVGRKFGAWHDVGWWARALAAPSSAGPGQADAPEPRGLDELDRSVVEARLSG